MARKAPKTKPHRSAKSRKNNAKRMELNNKVLSKYS